RRDPAARQRDFERPRRRRHHGNKRGHGCGYRHRAHALRDDQRDGAERPDAHGDRRRQRRRRGGFVSMAVAERVHLVQHFRRDRFHLFYNGGGRRASASRRRHFNRQPRWRHDGNERGDGGPRQ